MGCGDCSLKDSLPRYCRTCEPCLSHPVTKSCALTGLCVLCLPVGLPICLFYHCDQYCCCRRCRPPTDIGLLTMLAIISVAWLTYSTFEPEASTIFALLGVWGVLFAVNVHGRRCLAKMSNLSYFLVPIREPKPQRDTMTAKNKNHLYYCCGVNLLLLLMFSVLQNHPQLST